MQYFISIVAFLFLGACAPPERSEADIEYVTICYIPIGSGTFVPMTRENFEKQCTNLGRLSKGDSRYGRIFAALNDRSRNGTFDEYAVRVMLTLANGKVIFVDQEGVVDSAGVYTHMSTSSLAEIERILDELEEKIGPVIR